jgi:hypothetical protein
MSKSGVTIRISPSRVLNNTVCTVPARLSITSPLTFSFLCKFARQQPLIHLSTGFSFHSMGAVPLEFKESFLAYGGADKCCEELQEDYGTEIAFTLVLHTGLVNHERRALKL